jgi:SWI/SNF-related matrix-associated actin-dependent regulator 1 of chromatin subfamily A
MSEIIKLDNFKILLKKYNWSEEEQFAANSIKLSFNETYKGYICDSRLVHRKAIVYFLKLAFHVQMTSPLYKNWREEQGKTIKLIYKNLMVDFLERHYSKIKYDRDLYKHQKETLAYSIHKQFNLWALDMGLGKTITAATLSKITKSKRTIIICPTLVKWNWYSDMTKSWGYNPMFWTILDRNKSKEIYAFEERFVVLNYEQVKNRMDYLLKDTVSHVIIDECHAYKNHNSQRSKDLVSFLKQIPKARLTLLSGTPITNRVNDMFAYLRLVNHPLGKNKTKFEDQYTIKVGARGGKIIGAKNVDELKGLISNFMIRLKSEDCLDLPALNIQNLYLDSSELQGEYKEQIEKLKEKKKLYEDLHGTEKQKMNTEITNNIHTLNRIVATGKVKLVSEFIEGMIEEGEKVIVFSTYRDPINQLAELFKGRSVKIDGDVQPHARQMLIEKFIEDPKCMVYLANMTAGGIGVNLVNSRTVINMNFPFTPDKIEQALKRAHRSGQKRSVNVYNTIARDTIDEHIYELLSNKAEDINEVIDGKSEHTINYASLPNQLMAKLLS